MKFQYNIKSQLDKSLRQTKIELLTKVQYQSKILASSWKSQTKRQQYTKVCFPVVPRRTRHQFTFMLLEIYMFIRNLRGLMQQAQLHFLNILSHRSLSILVFLSHFGYFLTVQLHLHVYDGFCQFMIKLWVYLLYLTIFFSCP